MPKTIPDTPFKRDAHCSEAESDLPSFPCPLPPAKASGRVKRGHLNISIDRDGVWYHENSPISRKSLVCLFASVLTRDAQGDYWLVTPAEMGRIDVEDVPFIVVELYVAGVHRNQILSVRTNVDEIVTIDNNHPIRIATHPVTGEPSPYVTIRPGIEARLCRSVFYELVDLGVEASDEGAHIVGVWSRGSFFPLGSTETQTRGSET
jgi:uncharacterized protein